MDVDRLCKALEALVHQDSISDTVVDSGSPAHVKRAGFIRRRTSSKHPNNRNEKASLCGFIADALTSSTAWKNSNKDFTENLSLAVNIIITCWDDKDADTRLAAEEALNRICQVHIASHPVTILVDLFKVVKLNGSIRSVGAAWKRLTYFSNYITPQRFRCRAFVMNLIPCIISLAQREEDVLHEGLTEGVALILHVLGSFVFEKEIKRLVGTFLPNLSSESGVKRRAAANCIVEICLCSKKQNVIFDWLLRGLTGLIQTVADNASFHLRCGIIYCIRVAIAATRGERFNGDVTKIPESIRAQVLTTLIGCCEQPDHNVQGFALDALQTMLKDWEKPLLDLLTSSGDLESRGLSPTGSETSFDFDRESEPESSVLVDEETLRSSGLKTEDFGNVENINVHLGSLSRDSVVDRSDTASIVSSAISEDIFNSELDETGDGKEEEDSTDKVAEFPEDNDAVFEERSDSGQDFRMDTTYDNETAEIGRLFERERTPAEFIARFLLKRFLLENLNELEIKKNVRVSVQSAALGCLTTVLHESPSLFLLPLSITQPEGVRVFNVCMEFIQHGDPLMKAHGAVLSCQLVSFSVDNPLSTLSSCEILSILKKTIQMMKEQSPQACRLAVEALRKCIETLLLSDNQARLALEIFQDILDILRDPQVTYWLLKVELLRFLRIVPISHLFYVESVCRISRRSATLRADILSCLVHFLSGEDHRVRMAAAETLTWLPSSMAVPLLMSMHTYRILADLYEKHCVCSMLPFQSSMRTGLVFPYNINELNRSVSDIEDGLSSVVGLLYDNLIVAQEKYMVMGLLLALNKLSRYYPTTVYSRSWFGVVEEADLSMERYTAPVSGVLSRLLELLTSASLAADVQLQSDGLELLGNLFSGLALTVYVKPRPELNGGFVPWNHIGCFQLRTLADNLLRHLARILNLVRAVVENLKPSEIFAPSRTAVNLLASAVPGSSLSLRRKQDFFRRNDKKSKVGSFELRSKFHLGTLTTLDVYSVLYENIKKSWNKQRNELGKVADKCSTIVRAAVVCFAQILEMSNAETLSPNIDEIVAYLKITIAFHGQPTIYCIEQFLRCLFGCNLAQTDCLNLIREVRARFSSSSFEPDLATSFVEKVSISSQSVNFYRFPIGKTSVLEQGSSLQDHRAWSSRWERLVESIRNDSLEALFRGHFKEKRVAMSETIRQFESVVIKSLQLYTCTVEAGAQAQVLDLLVLLLQLHVNYNILDGEHVFFKYVSKQVELIETDEITRAESLLPYIFRFFVHLSHDRVFSQQNILTLGYIIQNCDSLLAASSQSGRAGVLPVLNLLVDDTLHRKTSGAAGGMDEKEAQLEVLLSVALRCLPDLKAFSIVKKFLLHQVTLSAGHFEKHVSELSETVFQKLLPNALSGHLFSDTHFIQEVLDLSECLRLIGCNPLMESASFRSFFSRLLELIQQMTSLNLGALSFFCCIIDVFVVNVAIEPLLKLFSDDSGQKHPLAEQSDVGGTELYAPKFVLIATAVFDTLFDVNTTNMDDAKQQELDYIYCTLLSTLSYFVHIVDQGPVKEALRNIQSTNRLEDDERFHLNPVCRIAWLRFRYAATGIDLEPRFWQPDVNFPIEDHICEVTWKFLHPHWSTSDRGRTNMANREVESSSQVPFTDPKEAQRIVDDFFIDDVSLLEAALYHKYCQLDLPSFFRIIFTSVWETESKKDTDKKWLTSLYSSPGSLSVHLSLVSSLSEVALQNDELVSLLGEKDITDVVSCWSAERSSTVKQQVLWAFGDKEKSESKSSILQALEGKALEFQHDDWIRSLAFHVALESTFESAQCVVALLAELDEETIVTVLSDERFPVCFLKDCFRHRGGSRELVLSATGKLSPLFQAARMVFLQRLKELVSARSVERETDGALWFILCSAFIELTERTNGSPSEVSAEFAEDCFQLILAGFQMLDDGKEDAVIRRRTLECTRLFLENSSFVTWARSRTDIVTTLVSKLHTLLFPVSVAVEQVLVSGEGRGAFPDTPKFVENVIEMAKLMDDAASLNTLFTGLECKIFTSLTKFPSVAEIVRIPPSAYELGWLPGKVSSTDAVPVEHLQETEVLKQFVNRVSRYGWCSKRQFEETWMAFLSILSSVPIDEENEADESQHENSVNSRLVAGRLALRCITALLLESVLAIQPNNTAEVESIRSNKLTGSVLSRTNLVAPNDCWTQQFAPCSRRSVRSLHIHSGQLEQTNCRWVMKGSPQPGAPNEQIDLKSCLKFVMDLYSHWTSDEKLKKLSPYILDEVVRSTLHLSSIFYEEKFFRWMLLFVKQVLRIKGIEESLFYGHLLEILGKALCVLDDDRDAMNMLKKAVDVRSGSSLMNRVSCSRMVLRILSQPSPSEDVKLSQWLQHLSTTLYEVGYQSRLQPVDALDVLFAIFVTEISSFEPSGKQLMNPYVEVLLSQLRQASSLSLSTLRGLTSNLSSHMAEKRADDGIFREQLVKAGLDAINLSPPRSLLIVSFLISCMETTELKTGLDRNILSGSSSPSVLDDYSDPLFILAMEKMAVIQQRRQKCYHVEAKGLGKLYLNSLTDKMPLNEATNRVMAEFQSCPKASAPDVARLVKMTFDLLKRRRMDTVVEEWIALSFCNFASRVPPELGIWSLACLFCAASSTSLVALFEFLKQRGVQLSDDPVLESVFLLLGVNFYSDIEVDETRKIFCEAVRASAGIHPVFQKLWSQLSQSYEALQSEKSF